MRGVPFFYAGLVAFPSAKPCSVALLPADQTDVPVTLFDQDVDQVLAVLGLVLMDRAYEVLGICSCLIDLGAGFFADDTEELCQIYAVVVAGLNGGCHLCIGGVADDDALAACGSQCLNRSGNLLGYVALVYVLDINAKSVGSFVQDQFALGTQNVGGAPDGDADLDLAVSSGSRGFACAGVSSGSCGGSAAADQCAGRKGGG